ncbi:MAG: RidA family protein [Chloroflexi bacterium]|nr:RidA family protein [Chloroflexota bacterium]
MPVKKIISTNAAPPAVGPYSQAIRAGSFLFLSGQLPLDPKSGTIVGDDIEAQTRQVILNIKSILAAEGLSLSDVVKTTVFLKDIQHFPKMNGIYKEFFSQDAPARSTFQVANLPMNALVEIESIAIAE